MNQPKSDVERFYDAMCAKMQINKPWGSLNPIQQLQFVQGINMILTAITEG